MGGPGGRAGGEGGGGGWKVVPEMSRYLVARRVEQVVTGPARQEPRRDRLARPAVLNLSSLMVQASRVTSLSQLLSITMLFCNEEQAGSGRYRAMTPSPATGH